MGTWGITALSALLGLLRPFNPAGLDTNKGCRQSQVTAFAAFLQTLFLTI